MQKVAMIFCGVGLLFLSACGFNEAKLRGTYELNLSEMIADEEEDSGLGAQLGRAIAGTVEMTFTFEDGGKGEMGVGMGILEGLAKAFGAENEVENLGRPMEWKIEEGYLYVLGEGETEWNELGKIVDYSDYDAIVLETVEEDGSVQQFTLRKKDTE